MGKKADRTKGNTQASSAQRAANTLGGASFVGFQTLSSSFTAEALGSAISADTKAILSKLKKKSTDTKVKALQSLLDTVADCDDEEFSCILTAWPRLYTRLSQDPQRRVRDATQKVFGKIGRRAKKQLAPHLKSLASAWLLSQFDSSREASQEATALFNELFGTKKENTLTFVKQEVFESLTENFTTVTAAQFADKEVDDVEAERKYERIILASSHVYDMMLRELPTSVVEEQQSGINEILGTKSFWKLAKKESVGVRAGCLKVIVATITYSTGAIHLVAKKILSTILGLLNDSSASTVSLACEGLLNAVASIENPFEVVNIDKALLPAVCKALKQGGNGTTAVFDATEKLFNLIPIEKLQAGHVSKLLGALEDGVGKVRFDKPGMQALVGCAFHITKQSMTMANDEVRIAATLAYSSFVLTALKTSTPKAEATDITLNNFSTLLAAKNESSAVTWQQALESTMIGQIQTMAEDPPQQNDEGDIGTNNNSAAVNQGESNRVSVKDQEEAYKAIHQLVTYLMRTSNLENIAITVTTKLSDKLLGNILDSYDILQSRLLHGLIKTGNLAKCLDTGVGLSTRYFSRDQNELLKNTLVPWGLSKINSDRTNDEIAEILRVIMTFIGHQNNTNGLAHLDSLYDSLTSLDRKAAFFETIEECTPHKERWVESKIAALGELVNSSIEALVKGEDGQARCLRAVLPLISGNVISGVWETVLRLFKEYVNLVVASDLTFDVDPPSIEQQATVQSLVSLLLVYVKAHPAELVNEGAVRQACSNLYVLANPLERSCVAGASESMDVKSTCRASWKDLVESIEEHHAVAVVEDTIALIQELFDDFLEVCGSTENESKLSSSWWCRQTEWLVSLVNGLPKEVVTKIDNPIGKLVPPPDEWKFVRDGVSAPRVELVLRDNLAWFPGSCQGEVLPWACLVTFSAGVITALPANEDWTWLVAEIMLANSYFSSDSNEIQKSIAKPQIYLAESIRVLFEQDTPTFGAFPENENTHLQIMNYLWKVSRSAESHYMAVAAVAFFVGMIDSFPGVAHLATKITESLSEFIDRTHEKTLMSDSNVVRVIASFLVQHDCDVSGFLLLPSNDKSSGNVSAHLAMLAAAMIPTLKITNKRCADKLAATSNSKPLTAAAERAIKRNTLPESVQVGYCSDSVWKTLEMVFSDAPQWLLDTKEDEKVLSIRRNIAQLFRAAIAYTPRRLSLQHWELCLVTSVDWLSSKDGDYSPLCNIFLADAAFVLLSAHRLFHPLWMQMTSGTTTLPEVLAQIVREWHEVYLISVVETSVAVLAQSHSKASDLTCSYNQAKTLLHLSEHLGRLCSHFGDDMLLSSISLETIVPLLGSKCKDVHAAAFIMCRAIFNPVAPPSYDANAPPPPPLADEDDDRDKILDMLCALVQPPLGQEDEDIEWVRGHFLAWVLFFARFKTAVHAQRMALTTQCRDNGAFSHLLCLLFEHIPPMRSVVADDVEKAFAPNADPIILPISTLAIHTYILLARRAPVSVRSWWEDDCSRQLQKSVEEFTRTFISPRLKEEELKEISSLTSSSSSSIDDDDEEHMVVRTRPTTGEIVAKYTYDTMTMELVMTLAPNHPLKNPEVSCSRRIGVPDNTWRSWLLQIAFSTGTLLESLQKWKRNVDKRFEGVDECTICYSVVQGNNYQLPKQKCKTCKNMFHSACLFKWFSTSNQSTCPLCRSVF